MIPIIGLIVGLFLGVLLPYNIPQEYSIYIAVLILAILDSVLGGYVSVYQGRFEIKIFLSGILGNSAIALALSFLGQQMNVPLYLAAVIFLGNRLFTNFATLRRLISAENEKKRAEKKANKKLKEDFDIIEEISEK